MDRRPVDSMAGATLIEILHSVRRNIPTAIVTFLFVTGLLAALIVVWPNRYISDGLMYVRLGRGAVSVDPTAGSSTVSLLDSRKSEVISVAKMLGSREIAERAVRKVGAEEVNKPRNWVEETIDSAIGMIPSFSSKSTGKMTAEEYEAQVAMEEAVKRVQDWVKIMVPKDSHTVSIAAKGSDPVLVQEIAQAFMDEYQSFHVEAHRASGALEFFEQQIADSRDAALSAQEELQKRKSELGWLSIASSEETLRERIIELEILRDGAESQYAESKSQAEALEKRLASIKEWVPTEVTSGIETKSGQDMRTSLFGLQVESSEAVAKFKEGHPRRQLVEKKVSQSKEIFEKEGKANTHSTEALNPVYQGLQEQYESMTAQAVGMKSKVDALNKSLERANSDLKRLNNDAVMLSNLKWTSDIAEQNYLAHAKSLEEARITAELDSREMSDVSVIQQASLNLKKDGPPRVILLALAVILGFMAGLLMAIIRDGTKTVGVTQSQRGHSEARQSVAPPTESLEVAEV